MIGPLGMIWSQFMLLSVSQANRAMTSRSVGEQEHQVHESNATSGARLTLWCAPQRQRWASIGASAGTDTGSLRGKYMGNQEYMV